MESVKDAYQNIMTSHNQSIQNLDNSKADKPSKTPQELKQEKEKFLAQMT